MTREQWIDAVLTAIIAAAMVGQWWFIRRQAKLLEKADRQRRERDKPLVRITPFGHRFGSVDTGGDATTREFDGFTVTNAGFRDIEITSFVFEIGKLLDSRDDPATSEITFTPVDKHRETVLTTTELPHRLKPGESFKILYDTARMIEETIRIGGETPIRMRPYCRDSLGNKHMPHHWLTYKKNQTAFFDGPSPGRISEEDWVRLPESKTRNTRWQTSSVGP